MAKGCPHSSTDKKCASCCRDFIFCEECGGNIDNGECTCTKSWQYGY